MELNLKEIKETIAKANISNFDFFKKILYNIYTK